MVGAMHSDELQLLIAGYVLCDLSPEEAAALEQQMAADPAVAAAVATAAAEMQQALETVYAPPEIEPPAHLRSAILAAASQPVPDSAAETTTEKLLPFPQTPAQSSTPQAKTLPTRQRRFWQRGLIAGAAALIAGLSISNYWLWRQVQVLQASAVPDSTAKSPLTFSLQPTGAVATTAAVQVVVDPNTLEAMVTVENLPPLPPGKVYALWTVVDPNAPVTTDDKNAILTEVFTVDSEGRASTQTPVPRAFRDNAVTAVAITIEDANAPQQHEASPILIQKL